MAVQYLWGLTKEDQNCLSWRWVHPPKPSGFILARSLVCEESALFKWHMTMLLLVELISSGCSLDEKACFTSFVMAYAEDIFFLPNGFFSGVINFGKIKEGEKKPFFFFFFLRGPSFINGWWTDYWRGEGWMKGNNKNGTGLGKGNKWRESSTKLIKIVLISTLPQEAGSVLPAIEY